jgi:hypothetical protein
MRPIAALLFAAVMTLALSGAVHAQDANEQLIAGFQATYDGIVQKIEQEEMAAYLAEPKPAYPDKFSATLRATDKVDIKDAAWTKDKSYPGEGAAALALNELRARAGDYRTWKKGRDRADKDLEKADDDFKKRRKLKDEELQDDEDVSNRERRRELSDMDDDWKKARRNLPVYVDRAKYRTLIAKLEADVKLREKAEAKYRAAEHAEGARKLAAAKARIRQRKAVVDAQPGVPQLLKYEALRSTAEKFEATAKRLEDGGMAEKAADYRKRAEEPRQQMAGLVGQFVPLLTMNPPGSADVAAPAAAAQDAAAARLVQQLLAAVNKIEQEEMAAFEKETGLKYPDRFSATFRLTEKVDLPGDVWDRPAAWRWDRKGGDFELRNGTGYTTGDKTARALNKLKTKLANLRPQWERELREAKAEIVELKDEIEDLEDDLKDAEDADEAALKRKIERAEDRFEDAEDERDDFRKQIKELDADAQAFYDAEAKLRKREQRGLESQQKALNARVKQRKTALLQDPAMAFATEYEKLRRTAGNAEVRAFALRQRGQPGAARTLEARALATRQQMQALSAAWFAAHPTQP